MTEVVAGIDEAGRGPLAGPVVAAAVILDPDVPIQGLADSKKLSASRREALATEIEAHALACAVAWADAAEIDAINILQSTFLAMRRALLGLCIWPQEALIDGNRLPDLKFNGIDLRATAIVGGDARVPSISAASILAKVCRDRMMRRLDMVYPNYGFSTHKGYGTARHLESIERYGPCAAHRQTFRPIRCL